jgi:hypothetical protein
MPITWLLKKKSKAAHRKAQSASPVEADRVTNMQSRATGRKAKSADQELADRNANKKRMGV